MYTALPALPLAEHLPAAETEQQQAINMRAHSKRPGMQPVLVAEFGWAAVERSLGKGVSDQDAARALEFGDMCVGRALRDPRLVGDRLVHTELLGVFWPEYVDRRPDGPQPIYEDTAEGILSVWDMVRGAVVHSPQAHKASTRRHELCFSTESQRSTWQIELAVLAMTAAAGVAIYPASVRERWPKEPDQQGSVHQLYVVTDGPKLPLRVFRSNKPTGIDPGIGRVKWSNIVKTVDALGAELTQQAVQQSSDSEPVGEGGSIDAAARFILDAMCAEFDGTSTKQQSDTLDAVQGVIVQSIRMPESQASSRFQPELTSVGMPGAA